MPFVSRLSPSEGTPLERLPRAKCSNIDVGIQAVINEPQCRLHLSALWPSMLTRKYAEAPERKESPFDRCLRGMECQMPRLIMVVPPLPNGLIATLLLEVLPRGQVKCRFVIHNYENDSFVFGALGF